MNVILFAVYLVLLFISLTASVANRKNLPSFFSLFSILLAVTFIIETSSFFLLRYTERNTQPAYHFLLPFTYIVHSVVYAKTFGKRKIANYLYFSIGGFLVIHLYLSIFVQGIYQANSYAFILAAALMATNSLGYLYHLMQQRSPVPIQKVPMFWISTGNLFFYCGAFFLMGSLNFLLKADKELAGRLFTIIYLLNFILYPLYTVGFLCVKRWKKL